MNTDKIYEKVKMKIAISNVKEEDMVMNRCMHCIINDWSRFCNYANN